MGTSTTGSELHSDKLAKLQARKKELEALLAAKNEDLYKLCVQEVKLTGVVPPETPAEAPESPAEGRRGAQATRLPEGPSTSRKLLGHRLSTPSISGLSIKSSPSMKMSPTHPLVSAPDTHSLKAVPAAYSRHHTLTAERSCRVRYSDRVDPRAFSSHPDISGRHPPQPTGHAAAGGVPLLYQYASELKARSSHLAAVQGRGRRGALQRTQTYHLTAPSDHPPLSPASAGGLSPSAERPKEKEWYESSLDSPTGSSSGTMNLSRESVQYHSLKRPVRRSPSAAPAPASPPTAAAAPPAAVPAPAPAPPAVPLESPKNCTVVESGKWIPYREVSKPFEMSDFYKYSTKFRQSATRPAEPTEVRTYSSPEQWRRAHPL